MNKLIDLPDLPYPWEYYEDGDEIFYLNTDTDEICAELPYICAELPYICAELPYSTEIVSNEDATPRQESQVEVGQSEITRASSSLQTPDQDVEVKEDEEAQGQLPSHSDEHFENHNFMNNKLSFQDILNRKKDEEREQKERPKETPRKSVSKNIMALCAHFQAEA